MFKCIDRLGRGKQGGGDVFLRRRSIAASTTPSFAQLSQFLTSEGDGTQTIFLT